MKPCDILMPPDLRKLPRTPLKTILICEDLSCGRCLNCEWSKKTKAGVGAMMAEQLGRDLLISMLQGAIKSAAERIGDPEFTVNTAQLCSLTPDQALEAVQSARAKPVEEPAAESIPEPTLLRYLCADCETSMSVTEAVNACGSCGSHNIHPGDEPTSELEPA